MRKMLRLSGLTFCLVGLLVVGAGQALAANSFAGEPMALSLASAVPAQAAEKAEAAPEILWPGFLSGAQGFDGFVHPAGSPLYFHDPFIDTRINLVYLWHQFPGGSNLKGGDLNVFAAQIFLALTDRLQLTAHQSGYSRLRANALQPADGFSDLAAGLKYALIADPDNDFILSTGLGWRLSNGHAMSLQGGTDELNPYVTMAKGFDKLHVIGTVGGRLAMNEHKGNHILYESLHLDYEVIENFFPMIELHGLHYLSDGDRLPLSNGGLDYANIGSNDVAGKSTFWGEVGFAYKFCKRFEVSAVYGFPISNPDNDIFNQRVTVNLSIGL